MTPGKTNTIVATNSDGAERSEMVRDVAKVLTVIIDNGVNGNTLDNMTRGKAQGTDDNLTEDTEEHRTNGDLIDINKNAKSNDDKVKIECLDEGELLGSLVTMNSPAVRTSARVIQKMKQDSIRPTTPPLPDKKDGAREDGQRGAQKTPSQSKASKPIWSNVERNLFFEALNEYGKEFESIAQFINVKQKRKNATDPSYKTKEHIRQMYYQSYHKVSKYLRFSDDIKKNVQELYTLINYGELRRKTQVPNQKCFMKLRELVYKGWASVRVKGKTYRIKTPSCKALRKINQIEEWQEDIKLPLKVDVILRPSNSESWYKVQSLAQNPRIKTTLPLQKRLLSLFKTLQVKWRSKEAKLIDQATIMIQSLNQKPATASSSSSTALSASTSLPSTSSKALVCDINSNATEGSSSTTSPSSISSQFQFTEPVFRIMPQTDVIIHRPMVNLTEFHSSDNICLNSYEERIGVTTRSETLCSERVNSLKEMVRANTKRQRHDSGSEKKSPDTKRSRIDTDKYETNSYKRGASTKLSDEHSTTDEEKFDADYIGTTSESAMFDIEGISQIADSLSADEYEDANVIKSEIKAEPFDEPNNIDTQKDNEADLEHLANVPECIKQNLIKKQKRDQKNSISAMNKKRDIRKESFRPLISEDVIKEIRKGWTMENVGDLTIGDLYVMFGQDSKVMLEYMWESTFNNVELKSEEIKYSETVTGDSAIIDVSNKLDDGAASFRNDALKSNDEKLNIKNPLTNKLKQLLLLVNLTEKTKQKKTCNCGHYCDRGANKVKKDEVLPRNFISSKVYPTSHTDSVTFRQPMPPIRTGLSAMEGYRQNFSNARAKQSRWLKNHQNRLRHQVVVKRLLLQPGVIQSYDSAAGNNAKFNGTSKFANAMTSSSVEKSGDNKAPMAKTKSLLTSENLNRINAHHIKYNNGDASESHNVKKVNSTLINANHDHDDEQEADRDQEVTCSDAHEDIIESTANQSTDEVTQQYSDDPGIQSLMEISLPSPFVAHTDEYFTYNNATPPMSPMTMLQDGPNDPRWYEDNLNDFSLSSFLGHLDACESSGKNSRSPSRGMDSSNLSTISETSIDYITKFEELAESMKNETSNILLQ